ncbi:ABC transporter permease [Paucibacter sp. O1-1]|nr:ABC transporter permease [Paucibacter sp. O1-1]MDA3825285.1 ABC transporter permease [Paucibacter sp. O1-1]
MPRWSVSGSSWNLLGFIGAMLVTLGKVVIGRRRLRLTATVFHMEQAGLDAVPIVSLLSFLVGAVVAFLGATVLRDFGAEIFTVELVSYSFLREFGVLLTAILLAGRSGSTFTAQIGSMKSREELDAIDALGLDPMELLVIPRLLALPDHASRVDLHCDDFGNRRRGHRGHDVVDTRRRCSSAAYTR